MRRARIFDALIDSLIYAFFMLISCLVCMCAEILIVKIIDLCVVIDYLSLCFVRTVIYTVGVNAVLSLVAYNDGYKAARCSVVGTAISCVIATVFHFLFSLLFGFEAFCAGGVRFIAGIVKYGSELTESSMIRNLHPADFVAVFFINGLIYCVLMTLFKKIGVKRRLIDREELTGSTSLPDDGDTDEN